MKRLSIDPAAEEELRAVVARYEMQQQGLEPNSLQKSDTYLS